MAEKEAHMLGKVGVADYYRIWESLAGRMFGKFTLFRCLAEKSLAAAKGY